MPVPYAERCSTRPSAGRSRSDNPPPATDSVTATNLGALGALGTQSFYSPTAKHRVAIVLTDGESRPFDVRQTARALGQSPGVTPIFVHISSPGEAVYDSTGRIESAYHSDPSSGQTLASLAQAAGGSTFRREQPGCRGPGDRGRSRQRPDEPSGAHGEHAGTRPLRGIGSSRAAAVPRPSLDVRPPQPPAIEAARQAAAGSGGAPAVVREAGARAGLQRRQRRAPDSPTGSRLRLWGTHLRCRRPGHRRRRPPARSYRPGRRHPLQHR